MRCEHVKAGGHDAIICGGPKKRLCEFCKRQYATKQCDFPIERLVKGRYPDKMVRRKGTCDAWMCNACAVAQGPNVDYCPPHERNKLQIMEARLRSRIGA